MLDSGLMFALGAAIGIAFGWLIRWYGEELKHELASREEREHIYNEIMQRPTEK